MQREKTVVHKTGKTEKRIQLVNPKKQNDMAKASGHFTPHQKQKAKNEYKTFKQFNPDTCSSGRQDLISAIATTKITPRYDLKVTLQLQ